MAFSRSTVIEMAPRQSEAFCNTRVGVRGGGGGGFGGGGGGRRGLVMGGRGQGVLRLHRDRDGAEAERRILQRARWVRSRGT